LTSTLGFDENTEQFVAPETEFMARQTHNAGAAGLEHLDGGPVAQAKLTQTMHLFGHPHHSRHGCNATGGHLSEGHKLKGQITQRIQLPMELRRILNFRDCRNSAT
jgi:hypothetical protein